MAEEFEKFEGLDTGSWLLNDEASGHLFGVVAAFGPPDRTGTIRLIFRGHRVQWEADEEGDVTIELPEQQARQLAEQLFAVAIKLEHLRTLERLGKLNKGTTTPEG